MISQCAVFHNFAFLLEVFYASFSPCFRTLTLQLKYSWCNMPFSLHFKRCSSYHIIKSISKLKWHIIQWLTFQSPSGLHIILNNSYTIFLQSLHHRKNITIGKRWKKERKILWSWKDENVWYCNIALCDIAKRAILVKVPARLCWLW